MSIRHQMNRSRRTQPHVWSGRGGLSLLLLLQLLLLVAVAVAVAQVVPARAQEAETETMVRAILFYSPTCPHCHKVIQEDLPPLFDQYPDELQIVGIDVSQPDGQALYQAAIERFNIPDERIGVPCLIVNDRVLVGSGEIPAEFPGLVETYLAQGGVDWPDIPGLATALEQQPSPEATEPPAPPAPTEGAEPATATAPVTATGTPAGTPPPPSEAEAGGDGTGAGLVLPDTESGDSNSIAAKFSRDPVGNGLAVIVLVVMVVVVGFLAFTLRQSSPDTPDTPNTPAPAWQEWAVPVLSLVGLVVAGYLTYIESTAARAVCGPVGDCNTVQQSEYARLFGVLPIGALGLAGYVAILAAWAAGRSGNERVATRGWLALFLMSLGGTLFSIYLTFLEPFVIGATCAWCLTSSVIMTALLLLSARRGRQAVASLSRS